MLKKESVIDSLKDLNIKEFNGILIQELPFIEKINLRFDPNNKEYISLCGKILDIILPTQPNTYSKNRDIKALWLGPDEWLVVNENENYLFPELENKFNNFDIGITDVSENRTIIRIKGEKIYKLLSKFVTLDLDKNLSNESNCAQTLFVKIQTLIVRNNNVNEIPEIDLFINRSHAEYIYDLIVDGTKNLDF